MDAINRKINVLFVALTLGAGGSERVVLDIARNLNRSLFNVYVAYFSGGESLEPINEVSCDSFHIHKKNGFDPKAMLQLARIIHNNRIDVVNPHHYASYFYSYIGAKILQRRFLIFTEHSVSAIEGLSNKHKKLCKLLFLNTDAIIGVSKQITDSIKNGYPSYSKKIITIVNGVDIDRFTVPTDRERVRRQLGILPSHFVIGTIANFRQVKNHACLTRAFCLLRDKFPHAILVLVGKGFPERLENTETGIKHLVHSLGLDKQVIFTGYRTDIPQVLKTFDIFCLPSMSEGLPVSILEAMAANIPVVGSNVKGINEIISPEVTGLLFPSNDAEALAKAIERLIKNSQLRSILSRNAFEYVSENHGMKQWISKYQQIFQYA